MNRFVEWVVMPASVIATVVLMILMVAGLTIILLS